MLANLVSTSAGMAVGFVAHGRLTFEAERLTLRHAAMFLATNVLTMWVVSPLVIAAVLAVLDVALVAKLAAIAVSAVVSWTAYRFAVWPEPSAELSPAPPPRP